MKGSDLCCWKCGASLVDVLMPFSRLAKCKACNVDLHVCCMCKFYDVTVSNSCTEPVAEKVTNKKLKNFCGFFQPDAAAYQQPSSSKRDTTRSQLDSLFGLSTESDALVDNKTLSEEEIARGKLEQLFGLKNDQ